MSERPKVFCIGLNKTGTTSFGQCMKLLGYNSISTDLQSLIDCRAGDLEKVFDIADRYESFDDLPWCLMYKELDRRYPGSKFVLTVRRDTETWLRSMLKHAENLGPTVARQLAYGHSVPHRHEEKYKRFYEEHNRRVVEHFDGRPSDFRVCCWDRGDSWPELCGFLGVGVPDAPFPHANSARPLRKRLFRKVLFNLGVVGRPQILRPLGKRP